MIKHIVMWRLKEEANGTTKADTLAEMKARLEALAGQIDEIVDFEVGLDCNRSDAAFEIALYSSFQDKAALERYQRHPKHVEAAGFIKKVACERAVVDYEI